MSPLIPISNQKLINSFSFGDSNHDFAVAPLVCDSSAVSEGCLFQRNDRADKCLKSSSVKQLCDFKQLLLARFDDEERILHALVRGGFAVRSDRHHASARLQHDPGSI